MRPLTPAETEAWRFYLSLHTTHWRPARHMFRRASQGEKPEANLIQFVADTGVTDVALLAGLEAVLKDLAAEGSQSG